MFNLAASVGVGVLEVFFLLVALVMASWLTDYTNAAVISCIAFLGSVFQLFSHQSWLFAGSSLAILGFAAICVHEALRYGNRPPRRRIAQVATTRKPVRRETATATRRRQVHCNLPPSGQGQWPINTFGLEASSWYRLNSPTKPRSYVVK